MKTTAMVSKYAIIVFMTLLLAGSMAWGQNQTQNSQTQPGQQSGTPEAQQQPAAPASTSWISNGAMLGPWWLMRSTKYDPRPQSWLYHLDLEYEYTKNKGNFNQEVHEGTARLILRKNIFTPTLAYSIEKRQMQMGETNIKYQKHKVVFDVNADLPKRFFVNGGMMYNKDEPVFVESQYMYYAGGGYYLIDTMKYQLKVGAGYAYSDMTPMFDAEKHNTDRFYFQELFFSPITPWLTIVQDFMYHQDASSSDDYFWELRIPFIVQVMNHVSLVPVFKLKHDELYRPEFIRSMPRKKEDMTINIQVKLSF